MPLLCYTPKDFGIAALRTIQQANEILEEYTEQGYDITLRQLYYQFVSRGLIPNNDREYKKLGSIVSDGRLAGLIDWDHIVDRTRHVRGLSHWDNPADIIETCSTSFRLDKWAGQKFRVEVWIEKDALVGVIERPCQNLDIQYFSCRGYTSQSEIWSAATRRLLPYMRGGQGCVILHFGDHDPSGIDMTRDIEERLKLFLGKDAGEALSVQRMALNMDQVRKYQPPPNPAKLTDTRARGYVEEFGDQSWELDALDPKVIDALITNMVKSLRDENKWNKMVRQEKEHIAQLKKVSSMWDKVVKHLGKP